MRQFIEIGSDKLRSKPHNSQRTAQGSRLAAFTVVSKAGLRLGAVPGSQAALAILDGRLEPSIAPIDVDAGLTESEVSVGGFPLEPELDFPPQAMRVANKSVTIRAYVSFTKLLQCGRMRKSRR